MLMNMFLGKAKGSITVMVTLIMVPTIFFTGFMVDLSRVKLCADQAVMAADNYGEAILTEYDALLKEMYGLFAVTQNKEGQQAVKNLEEYMKTSYEPTSSMISWNHLAGLVSPLKKNYTGFMPYKNADVAFSYELKENSRLSDPRIMSTQIGDFMRFRVVQALGDNGDILLEALETVQNTDKDSEVIKDKDAFDDAAGTTMDKMKEYYKVLKRLQQYPDYLKTINQTYQNLKNTEFPFIKASEAYKHYRDYVDYEREIKRALDKDEEDRNEEDEKYVEMYEAYIDDPEARKEALIKTFNKEIDIYEESSKDATDESVDFKSFDKLCKKLEEKAEDVKTAMTTLAQTRETLEESLQGENVSQSLKDGISEELQEIDKLADGDFSGDNYIALAMHIQQNSEANKDYQLQVTNTCSQLAVIRDDYLTPKKTSVSSYTPELSLAKYDDFQTNASYQRLYESLKKTFDSGNDAEEHTKQKKKEAENNKKTAEQELEKEETTTARDIPNTEAFQGIGDNRTGGGFKLGNLINTAASYFSCNSFGEAANKLLLKFYTVIYDFGMFSSRTTDQKKDINGNKIEEKAVSLTGIEMSKRVNYLYQAELEYLFGGHKSSSANLNEAKRHILAFRSVTNFTATYTISSINAEIRTISTACSAINPILGLAAAGALRSGIAAMETAADWKELSEGRSVPLLKTNESELTAVAQIDALLGITSRKKSGVKALALDYDQYLMLMTIFLTTSDQVIKRTSDLITLNINAVQSDSVKNGKELTGLSFKMDHAYTAVDATCAVHLDFVVMPDGFAKQVVDEDTYGEIKHFEKNTYQFTVTRGY